MHCRTCGACQMLDERKEVFDIKSRSFKDGLQKDVFPRDRRIPMRCRPLEVPVSSSARSPIDGKGNASSNACLLVQDCSSRTFDCGHRHTYISGDDSEVSLVSSSFSIAVAVPNASSSTASHLPRKKGCPQNSRAICQSFSIFIILLELKNRLLKITPFTIYEKDVGAVLEHVVEMLNKLQFV